MRRTGADTSRESRPRRYRFVQTLVLSATFLIAGVEVAPAIEVPFAPPREITASALGARSIFAADLDRDGDLDVLCASADDDTIAYYENDGDSPPGWTKRTVTSTARGARSVSAVDVDRDGDTDVLSASFGDDTIAWFENDGASIPGWTPRTIASGAVGASSVFAADLDGDGDPDVLSASEGDDTIAWFENDGSPTDWTQNTITTGADGARSVFAADLDGDGDLDPLAASQNDDTVAWFENLGPQAPAWPERTISTSSSSAQSVHAADLDRDGDLDVLSASSGDDTIAWFENDGASPPGWTARAISASVAGARDVFAADLDRDGDLDVLSASSGDDTIAWFENDGASPPGWMQRTISATAAGARAVLAADLDGDGDADVLSASEANATVAWSENRTIHRNAAFPPESTLILDPQPSIGVFAADLDGDGDADALTVDAWNQRLSWHENDGNSPPGWLRHSIDPSFSSPSSVFAADLDGDGDLDPLAASRLSDSIDWYENDPAPGWTEHSISSSVDYPQSIFVADVDGDGDNDVLSASLSVIDQILWFENDGASPPGWEAHALLSSTWNYYHWSVFAADLDGDGDVDGLSASNSAVAWYENDGAASPQFTPHTISLDAGTFLAAIATDVDRDGDLDVISSAYNSDDDDLIVWHENDGNSPPVWTPHTVARADRVLGLCAMDMDGDGDTDILSTNADSGPAVVWHENDGGSPPGWTEQAIVAAALGASKVFAADLDGDGDVDAISNPANTNWNDNRGGQFGLTTTDVAPVGVLDAQVAPVLAIEFRHHGRAGDPDAQWRVAELLFEEAEGDPLSSAEANALFDAVDLYLDDGSGEFEPGLDTLVAGLAPVTLSAGSQTVVFGAGDENFRVAPPTSKLFFVVVGMAGDATSSGPRTFRVSHVGASGAAEHRDLGLPLAPAPSTTVASSPVFVGTAAGAVPNGTTVPGALLTLRDSATPGEIELAWGESCVGSDIDFGVYEGLIGDFTSHQEKTCSTGGATTTSIMPGPDSSYYLVVPLNSDGVEGSYGVASDGTPRAQGISACAPQDYRFCP